MARSVEKPLFLASSGMANRVLCKRDVAPYGGGMSVPYKPKDFGTVTPYLIVSDADKLIAFLKATLDAEEVIIMRGPEGKVNHACFRVGDSNVEFGQANEKWNPFPAALHVYVPDTDGTYQKALAAGGTSIYEPMDMFYGERSGGVADPVGNHWFFATQKEELSLEELEKRAAAFKAKG